MNGGYSGMSVPLFGSILHPFGAGGTVVGGGEVEAEINIILNLLKLNKILYI